MKTPITVRREAPLDEDGLLADLQTNFSVEISDPLTEKRAYFDTFDWRLHDAGWIAFRAAGRLYLQSLKNHHHLNESCGGGDIIRPATDLPETRLQKILIPLVDCRALIKMSTVTINSREIGLLNTNRKTVCRLRIEKFAADSPESGRAQIVLYPVRGYDAAFDRLVEFLAAREYQESGRHPHWTAVSSGRRRPGDYTSKPTLSLAPETPAVQAVRDIAHHLVTVMRRNEAGILADIDPEFLHDFRVAVRRTRSLLGQTKGVFPEAETEKFREKFAAIGRMTNLLRDLDVYLLDRPYFEEMLPAAAREDLVPVFAHLAAQRQKTYRSVAKELRAASYRKAVQEWEVFLTREDLPAGPRGDIAVIRLAGDRIRKRYRRIRKRGRQIGPASPDSELHRLRIDCKKLRYLLEFFRSLYPPGPLNRLLRQLKKLQDHLGRFNDHSVQIEMLQDIPADMAVRSPVPPETVLTVGRLLSTLGERKNELRRNFRQTFDRFASSRMKSLVADQFAER